jgi:hypothetical protein
LFGDWPSADSANHSNRRTLLSSGAVISSGAFVGAPGAYTVPAVRDYDGDLKADILLRDSTGSLGMWIMNGSTITSGAFVGSPGANYNVY